MAVVYAGALHLGWGLNLVLFGPDSRHATGVALMDSLVPKGWLGPSLLMVGGLAFISVARSKDRRWCLALLPQQAALLLSAMSALEAILTGHFADGVPRPATFIFADQFPYLLLPFFHTFAILRYAGGQWKLHSGLPFPPLL